MQACRRCGQCMGKRWCKACSCKCPLQIRLSLPCCRIGPARPLLRPPQGPSLLRTLRTCTPRTASVPSTSSASTPAMLNTGMRMACEAQQAQRSRARHSKSLRGRSDWDACRSRRSMWYRCPCAYANT